LRLRLDCEVESVFEMGVEDRESLAVAADVDRDKPRMDIFDILRLIVCSGRGNMAPAVLTMCKFLVVVEVAAGDGGE
jgi:hypothetical protein